MPPLVYSLDIFGTFIFAIAGALKAVRYQLDLFGVMVLALATGVGGGVMRDVLMGFGPAAIFHDENYLVACLAGALTVFFFARKIAERLPLIRYADALGLGVFTAIGAAKALSFGFGPLGVVMLAVITATGGGVLRDLLVTEIPNIIRTDFYATAAAIGAMSMLAGASMGLAAPHQLAIAAATTTGLRIAAIIFRMRLPRPPRLFDTED